MQVASFYFNAIDICHIPGALLQCRLHSTIVDKIWKQTAFRKVPVCGLTVVWLKEGQLVKSRKFLGSEIINVAECEMATKINPDCRRASVNPSSVCSTQFSFLQCRLSLRPVLRPLQLRLSNSLYTWLRPKYKRNLKYCYCIPACCIISKTNPKLLPTFLGQHKIFEQKYLELN